MKIKITSLVIVLIFLGLTIRDFVTGVSGITKSVSAPPSLSSESGDLCEFEVDYAIRASWINKKVHGMIGSRMENYYMVGFNKSMLPIMVNLDPEWVSENFDSKGHAKNPVTIRGEVRKYIDDLKPGISNIAEKFAEKNINISAEFYIEPEYQTRYILRIINVVLRLIAIAATAIISLRYENTSLTVKRLVSFYVIFALIVCYVLRKFSLLF